MSFGRANGRSPIRPTWVNSNDCFEYRSKQHGAYAFAHPAEGDPTFGRDPTDAFYEGVHMRQWHGQHSVSGQDIGHAGENAVGCGAAPVNLGWRVCVARTGARGSSTADGCEALCESDAPREISSSELAR